MRFLKLNGNRISGSISTTQKDYIINYQDLQGIDMTGKLALPTLIALCSIALGRPVQSSTAVLGEIKYQRYADQSGLPGGYAAGVPGLWCEEGSASADIVC